MSKIPRRSGQPPPVIIPAWLDDAGLRPAVFRVLCRIARRGECFESLKNIAEGCRMKRETVQKAIHELLKRDFITAEYRPGATTKFKINEPSY